MQYTPQRLDRANRAMKRDSVDALVVTNPVDVQYLTGYESTSDSLPAGCIIAPDTQPLLVVPEIQKPSLENGKTGAQIHFFNDEGSEEWGVVHSSRFWGCVVETLKEHNMLSKTVGLQMNRLSVKEFETLKSLLPAAGFKDFGDALWRLRQIKDPMEIDAIRKAVKVAEIGMRTALEIVVPGKSGIDASIEIESAMRSAGGQPRGIRAAVLAGANSHVPFARPSAERIRPNDTVIIDITVSHSGYFAELARTLHPGTPNADQRKAFAGAIEATNILEGLLIPGKAIGEIADRTMAVLKDHDGGLRSAESYGSSIGLSLREPPQILSHSEVTVREGMVFSVHPALYSTKGSAAKIGDMVLVTMDGPENLTLVSRETM